MNAPPRPLEVELEDALEEVERLTVALQEAQAREIRKNREIADLREALQEARTRVPGTRTRRYRGWRG